jgi:hypothetical protein
VVLTDSLAELVSAAVPSWLPGAKPIYRTMARHFLDPATAEVLGLTSLLGPERAEENILVSLIRKVERAALTRLAVGRLGRPLAAAIGQHLVSVAEELPRGTHRPPFQLPAHLAASWQLPPSKTRGARR